MTTTERIAADPRDEPSPAPAVSPGSPATAARRRGGWRGPLIGGAAVLSVVVVLAAVVLGTADATLGDLLRSIGIALTGGEPAVADKQTHLILLNLRLPRVLLAFLAGAVLALAGAVMQGLLRNPLVSPDTLGVSQAAAFGAALSILFGTTSLGALAWLGTTGFALASALACTVVIMLLSTLKKLAPVTLILLGIALSALFAAAQNAAQFLADERQLAAIVHWTFGTVNNAEWFQVGIVGAILAVILPFMAWKAKDLNAVTFAGDDAAKSLGVNVTALRFGMIILAVVVTSVVVSFCGVIGFVSLVGPHIGRLVIGADHRFLLPFAALAGGMLLVLSDLAGRTIFSPIVVPVGIVTAVVGAPVFVALIMSRKAMQQ